jgi:CheY-like chemotaxis protein
MPVMDGLEMLTRLKNDPDLSSILVIMTFFAPPHQEMLDYCYQLGIQEYVIMPCPPADILSAVDRTLENTIH